MQPGSEHLLATKGRDGSTPRGRCACLLRLLALATLVHWPSEARASSLLVTRLSSQVSEYDAMTGSFIRTVARPNTPTGVAVGPDGTVLIADQTRAESDGAEILKVDATGAVSVFATEGIEGIFGITFGPNGNVFASSTQIGSAAKVVQYDGQTGILVGTFVAGPVNGPAPGGLAFGPNGDLFVGESGAVLEYDGVSGTLVRVFASGAPLNAPNGLFFMSGGNLVVADSFGGLLEFDGASGAFVRNIDATGRFVGVAADPAGSLYASELDTAQIRSYDWPAGTPRGPLISLPDFPEGIAFTPAGGVTTTTTTRPPAGGVTTTTTTRPPTAECFLAEPTATIFKLNLALGRALCPSPDGNDQVPVKLAAFARLELGRARSFVLKADNSRPKRRLALLRRASNRLLAIQNRAGELAAKGRLSGQCLAAVDAEMAELRAEITRL